MMYSGYSLVPDETEENPGTLSIAERHTFCDMMKHNAVFSWAWDWGRLFLIMNNRNDIQMRREAKNAIYQKTFSEAY